MFGCQPKHATSNRGSHRKKTAIWFSSKVKLLQKFILSLYSSCLSSSVWQVVAGAFGRRGCGERRCGVTKSDLKPNIPIETHVPAKLHQEF